MDMKSFYANEKPKTKRKGFSLVEMMVVMLLIAVVLAASAPMITRKVSRERSDKIFDMLGTDPNNAVEYVKGRNQRIFMNGKTDGYVGIVETGVNIPANSILFGKNSLSSGTGGTATTNLVGIGFGTTNYLNSVAIGYKAGAFTDAVSIGKGANGNEYGVAIGSNSQTRYKNSVAIGYNARTVGENAITIGAGPFATDTGKNAISIGYNADAIAKNGIAIGYNASATDENSVAIGYNATAPFKNSIVLGTEKDTVYIPGNLIIGKTTAVGVRAVSDGRSYPLYAYTHRSHDGDDRHFTDIVDVIERNHADDYKGSGDFAVAMVGSRTPGIQLGPYTFRTHAWSSGYNDNQKICPPTNSGDWYRISRGKCSDVDQSSNNVWLWSDARLKNIGNTYTSGLEELNQLKFYHFTFKNDKDKTPQVGVIAQDLQKVFPQAVSKDDGGWLTIRWDEMFYAAINAIKELNTKVCAIAKDVTNLKTVTDEHTKTLEAQAQTIEQQQVEIKELTARVEKLEQKRK